jgi:hypothetical protein
VGRHAHPDRGYFARSVAVAVTRALFAVGLAVGFTLALARVPFPVGSQASGGPAVIAPAPTATPRDLPDEEEPTPLDTVSIRPDASASTAPSSAPSPELQPASETTVQVLDGVNDPERLDDVVATLRALGYEVVATNPAARNYDVTTVLYSQGHEAEAEALRTRDPRFAELAVNENLSETVDVHVVVGRDWGTGPAGGGEG